MAVRYIAVKISHNLDTDYPDPELATPDNPDLIDRRYIEWPSNATTAFNRFAKRTSWMYFFDNNPVTTGTSSCTGSKNRTCAELLEDYHDAYPAVHTDIPGLSTAAQDMAIVSSAVGQGLNSGASVAAITPWFYSPIQVTMSRSREMSPAQRLLLYGSTSRPKGLASISYYELDSGTMQRSESGGLLDGSFDMIGEAAQSILGGLGF
jgi:hypothetical protein